MDQKTFIPSKTPVESLEKVLAQQVELYRTYAESLKRDSDFMAHLQIDALEQNNKSKGTVLLKIQTMDQARQNLIKQIAVQFGIAEDKVKITEICKFLSASASARLLQLRGELAEIIAELKEVQESTKLLASTSLAWINGSIATLRGILTPAGTYNPQGRVDHPSVFSGRRVEKQI